MSSSESCACKGPSFGGGVPEEVVTSQPKPIDGKAALAIAVADAKRSQDRGKDRPQDRPTSSISECVDSHMLLKPSII